MEAYETIKRGRALLQASRAIPPSARTIAGYKAKARRIAQLARAAGGTDIGQLIACAKRTRSASTWFSRRAALLYSFRLGVEGLLAEQDRLQRALKVAKVPNDSTEWDGWKALITKMRVWIESIERLEQEPGPAIGNRKRRHSKRKDMKGLPEDWRERLIARLPKYRQAALTAAVTGCRPEELVKGVRLTIEGGELIALINGAKVTEKSGQPWRRLAWSVDSDSPLVAMLVEEVRNGLEVAKIEDAKAFSGAVRAAGAREWPTRRRSLAPYCFRHAAASDMKAGGIGDVAISQALGHCVDAARSYYGQWQQGRESGGVVLKSVKSARPVRMAIATPSALALTHPRVWSVDQH